MATEIERMNRKQKNMIKGIFLATTVAFIWCMLPTLAPGLVGNRQNAYSTLVGSSIFWLLSLLVFGVLSRLHKKKLRGNPSLYDAVNDDRIKLGWLKAYRLAFIVAFITSVFWWYFNEVFAQWYMSTMVSEREMLEFMLRTGRRFPNGPFLVLYIAILFLFGTYLFFSRERKDG